MSRLIEILHLVFKYIDSLKKLPKNDERFTVMKEACPFLLCVVNDLEPFLNYFSQNAQLYFSCMRR